VAPNDYAAETLQVCESFTVVVMYVEELGERKFAGYA
jgi:hypothetical protein